MLSRPAPIAHPTLLPSLVRPWRARFIVASFSLMAAVALAGCGQTPASSATGPPMHLDRKTIEFGAGVTAEFVYIDAPRVAPDGFLMGSPVDQVGHRESEPQFRAVLTQGYWLQTTEVTQEQWESVMGTNPSQLKGGRNHPVEMVSWEDCQVFIGHLRRRGIAVRLPTEAEWEFACRAGTTTAFSFGDGTAQASEYAWFGDNSGRERINSAAEWASSADAEAYEQVILENGATPHPVSTKRANQWGLYDMHGNILEWCADWYGDYPSGRTVDPFGPATGEMRVLRGGSFGIFPRLIRSANRDGDVPIKRGYFIGFRLALDAD